MALDVIHTNCDSGFNIQRLSPLHIFLCTYGARLSNIQIPHSELTKMLVPSGDIKAINSNFGHSAQPGYEAYLKRATPRPAGPHIPGRRVRRGEGDRTCFNSAIEPVIVLDENSKKHYALKCFSTTGQIQVPGVVDPQLADGRAVVARWADFLTAQGIGDVKVLSEGPIMINYNFRVRLPDDRHIIELDALVRLLKSVKDPPFPIREVIKAKNTQKMSAKFVVSESRITRLNTFVSCKVNLLGARNQQDGETIYRFMAELFERHWPELICTLPEPDRLDDPGLDHVGHHGVEEHDAHALHHDAVGGGLAAGDPGAHAAEDVRGEDVAAYQQKNYE